MGSIRDPRRLPVYIDRVNNRLLADPQNGSAFFVITPIGGGSSPPASLSQAGIVQLEDSVASSSITKAATPNSVRQAFDLADVANSAAIGAAANATTALNNSQSALNTANSISATADQAVSTANAASATANAASATANAAASAVGDKLDKVGGTVTGDLVIGPLGRLGFEGATNNVFETYIGIADPTADRLITLPNADGTVALLETSNTWSGTQSFAAHISFPSASCTNQLDIGPGGSIAFEGSTVDGFEAFLYATDPTADRSLYLPDKSGTLAVREELSTVGLTGSYNDLNARPTLGTAAALNVAASGDATASQVVKGNDTRLATNLGYTASTRTLTSSTGSSVILPLVSATNGGLAPASSGGTANFLRADGVWAVPPGSQGTDGDRGDITVSNEGTTWTIDNGVVTYAKMQVTSTGNRILGVAGSLPGVITEIPCTQAGRDLIGASDVATQRLILNLGDLAQRDSLGNISSTGAIGSLAGLPLVTTTGGVVTTGSFGTAAGTFCSGNDARLSDARRTPSSLAFSTTGNGGSSGTLFDGSVARTISYNSVGAAAEDHSHGNITNAGAIGLVSGRPIITTLNGVLTTGTFGNTTGTFCAGDDSRLSDRRLVPNSLTFNDAGSGVASGSTFDGSAARVVSYNSVGAAASSHSHGSITNGGAIGTTSGLPIITGAGGVLQTGSFGTSAGTFCQGNDSRLASSPTPNALTFSATGGANPNSTFNGSSAVTISPVTIGAIQKAGDTMTGDLGVISLNGGPLAGFRNRITNGAMRINQRYGPNTRVVASGSYEYVFDRWKVYAGGAALSVIRGDAGGIYPSVCYVTCSTNGSNYAYFNQHIEAIISSDLAGRACTLSFACAKSNGGNVNVLIYANSGAIEDYSTQTLIASQQFAVSSTGTNYALSFTMPASATKGISVQIVLPVGLSNGANFWLTNVQLENGSQSTPYERRPVVIEKILCQRYYGRFVSTRRVPWGSSSSDSAQVFGSAYYFPVEMRATPTVSVSTSPSGATISEITIDGFNVAIPSSSSPAYITSVVADIEL